jgi:nucleoside-diphosphate-sugar epimerase
MNIPSWGDRALRVVVTGAAGLLGRHVAAACMAAGHDVRGVDIAPHSAEWETVTADLCDLSATVDAFAGAEAIAHCAAIPRPTGNAAAEVWRVNMATIFAATEAARIVRAGLFVQASSFSILGYPFAPRLPVPSRLPIDESAPAAPQDVYGTTKWLAEERIAAMVRTGAFRAVMLRMPWVQTAGSFWRDIGPRRSTPEAAADLWAWIDAGDAGRAFAAALAWRGDCELRCYVSASTTYAEQDSRVLIAGAFGLGVRIDPALGGHDSLISGALAAAELGFRPTVDWRVYPHGGAA